MEILMVTAELSPFVTEPGVSFRAGASGVGDAVSGLSRALLELGHKVTIAVPRATGFEEAGLMLARRLTPLTLDDGRSVTVYDGQLPSGVKLVLFESAELESRAGAYGEDGKDYPDLAQRLVVLCQASAAFAAQRADKGEAFDVIHAHDCAGAIMPSVTGIKTVLSVYDATRQCSVPFKDLESLQLGQAPKLKERFRLGSRANLLKGGMLGAAWVCSAGSSYAAEMIEVDFTGALGAALSKANVEIQGVPCGIDYAIYNPATDTALPHRFDAEASERKGLCKTSFLKELEFPLAPERPLVVFADVLSKGAGADLLIASLPELTKSDSNIVVLGKGGKALTKQLGAARLARLPNYRFVESDDDAQRRAAMAAADIALCPTRMPELGDRVRVAQRYGAVPVALNTPIVRDIVIDVPSDLGSGTGFTFADATAIELAGAAQRALSAWRNPGWSALCRRVMRLDSGWERSARRYTQLYKVIAARAA